MKTSLARIATLLLLVIASQAAGAAETTARLEPEQNSVAHDRDRLGWQRVGAPDTLPG